MELSGASAGALKKCHFGNFDGLSTAIPLITKPSGQAVLPVNHGDKGMRPNNILEKVKEFLIRLVKDSTFITQLQQRSADQVQSFLQDAGYDFSQDEFESATLKILDLKEQNQFHELSEAELVGAVGGWLRLYPGWFLKKPGRFPIDGPIVQPMYGVIIEPHDHPTPEPKPLPFPDPQPMYGVVIEPIDSIVQPMYGVITPPELL
ncbi:MAG: Nif11-like leader peptide family RiPP precursor [Cyanobacteria bacterium P01_C01_bin.118]